jgi:vitamin B12 transporter
LNNKGTLKRSLIVSLRVSVIISCCWSINVFAQTSVRSESSTSNQNSSAPFLDTEVNAESAENFGDLGAVESMRSVSGVQVQTSGSIGEEATIRIRGTTDDQNLVMIDGVPVNSAFDNAFDFADLLLGSFDKIDVYKGSQSGYYGTTAMGGAVNLLSSEGKAGPLVTPFFWGGSYVTFHEGVKIQDRSDKFDYFFQVARTDKGEDLGNDEYKNTNASISLGWRPIPHLELSFKSRVHQAEKNIPVDVTVTNTTPFTLSFVPDENRQAENLFLLESFKARAELNPWYVSSLQLAYFSTDADNSNAPDTSGSLNPNVEYTQIDFKRLFVRLNNEFTLHPLIKVEADYEFSEEFLSVNDSLVDPPVFSPLIDTNRANHAGIIRAQGHWEDWQMQAGGRIDHFSDAGVVLSPQVRVSNYYRPYGVLFEGGYSKGFRAPALRETTSPIVGNPDLDPETVHAITGCLTKVFGDHAATLRATYFLNIFEDLIAVGALAKFENVEEAQSQGIESEICAKMNADHKIDGCVGYTYTNSEIKDAAGLYSPIPLISEHNATLQVVWGVLKDLEARVGANFRGPQSIAAITGVDILKLDGSLLGNETDAFFKLDLGSVYNDFGHRAGS